MAAGLNPVLVFYEHAVAPKDSVSAAGHRHDEGGSNAADVPPFQMTDQLTVCAVRKTLAAVCGESGTWDLCAKELQTVGSRLIENRFDFLLKGVHRTKHASHVYEIASPRHLG